MTDFQPQSLESLNTSSKSSQSNQIGAHDYLQLSPDDRNLLSRQQTEIDLTSLSSDSGVQVHTDRPFNMSATDKLHANDVVHDDHHDDKLANDNSSPHSPILTRKNSVRARANMFQAMEEQSANANASPKKLSEKPGKFFSIKK